MNTTNAITVKSITFAIRSPYKNVDFPTVKLISLRFPTSGIANPINGETMSFTNAETSFDAACPITNAIANPITPNFCKKSTNSFTIPFFASASLTKNQYWR